jgi:hypothetical protein
MVATYHQVYSSKIRIQLFCGSGVGVWAFLFSIFEPVVLEEPVYNR